MQKRTIRVLIADDHFLVAEGLRLYLHGREGLRVVGTAASGREAIERCNELQPDVLLLDIRMPNMDGLTALATIRHRFPDLRVIVITSYPEPGYLARAVSLDVAGFLSKDVDPKHIPAAIYAAWSGDTVLDRSLLRQILITAGDLQDQGGPRVNGAGEDLGERLTNQEVRVLRLIGLGLDNAAISETLVLSRNTVKKHVQHILAKLEVSDRTKAAIWAVQHGIGSTPDHP
jgi:DNA-binding NarL/FixJ family response regulator